MKCCSRACEEIKNHSIGFICNEETDGIVNSIERFWIGKTFSNKIRQQIGTIRCRIMTLYTPLRTCNKFWNIVICVPCYRPVLVTVNHVKNATFYHFLCP